MTAQLSFKLKDHYTIKIWNPAALGDNELKSISGEYFFSVLFSVYREINSENKSVSEHAKKILAKFLLDISAFEKEITGLIKIEYSKKIESCFTLSFENPDKSINVSLAKNSGVCPESAAFLRSFIKFDEYIYLLSEIKSMAIISEKEYYKKRTTARSKIGGIIEGYHGLVKRFHGERKKLAEKMESVA